MDIKGNQAKQDNLAHALAFAAGTLYAMAGQYADLEGNAAKRKREMWEMAGDWLAEKVKELKEQANENRDIQRDHAGDFP